MGMLTQVGILIFSSDGVLMGFLNFGALEWPADSGFKQRQGVDSSLISIASASAMNWFIGV